MLSQAKLRDRPDNPYYKIARSSIKNDKEKNQVNGIFTIICINDKVRLKYTFNESLNF